MGYTFGQAGNGSIKGSVIDGESDEPIPFVKVVLYQGGIIKGGILIKEKTLIFQILHQKAFCGCRID